MVSGGNKNLETGAKNMAAMKMTRTDKLLRAAKVILFDRDTRKMLSGIDRMAFRQLEEAVKFADANYETEKDKLYRQWSEEDEAKYQAENGPIDPNNSDFCPPVNEDRGETRMMDETDPDYIRDMESGEAFSSFNL